MDYVTPKLELETVAVADVISSSVTYDGNETAEDKFFAV
jgi:hypothetical protein